MKFKLYGLAFLTLIPLAHAELYDGKNHPSNFNRIIRSNIVLDFNSLPKVGKLFDNRLGWSETYWPSNLGGIAYRWNNPNPQPFKYHLNTKEELLKMSQSELAQLSPAELYDIAMGDYNYTLTKTTLSHFSTRDLWWEGICHGWSQASSHYPEPDQVIVINPHGIKVPFGSSDVKGLLAMHEAYNYKGEPYGFVGGRCKVAGKVVGEGDDRDNYTAYPPEDQAESSDCRDVNAGSFHLILTNLIGIHGKGFVADVDRFNDVWNQPITNYTTEVIREEPIDANDGANGVTKKLRVKTRMTYGEELKFYTPELAAQGKKNFVSKLPVTMTEHQEFRFKDYEYILELNSRGMIVGGEWMTSTRPDFMWMYERPAQFKNAPIPLAGLGKIYRPVRR
ncbi:MAG: hypothetical protein AB7I27_12600 [Bacteriovoracaceae bacterium]